MTWDVSMLWYIGRGSGLVAEVLLTVVLVLGTVSAIPGGRRSIRRRVVDQGLHRQLTLAAVVVLVVHITSLVLDQYVDLDALDVLIPFGSSYRTIWLGMGTLAVDLTMVIVVTSLFRHRLTPGLWRGLHFTAYGAWSLAVAHGFFSGTDATETAVIWLTAGCVAAVAMAVTFRLEAARSNKSGRVGERLGAPT